MNDSRRIIRRLKRALGLTYHADLADALHVSVTTVYSWSARGRLDYPRVIELCRTHGLSLDWILLGRTNASLHQTTIASDGQCLTHDEVTP